MGQKLMSRSPLLIFPQIQYVGKIVNLFVTRPKPAAYFPLITHSPLTITPETPDSAKFPHDNDAQIQSVSACRHFLKGELSKVGRVFLP